MKTHPYIDGNPLGWDSNCAVCGGKCRDSQHGATDEIRAANRVKVLSKAIEFAYPTSDTAAKFGHGKTGCYAVYFTYADGRGIARPVAAFLHRPDAVEAALSSSVPWSAIFLHFNNEDGSPKQ